MRTPRTGDFGASFCQSVPVAELRWDQNERIDGISIAKQKGTDTARTIVEISTSKLGQ